ncbi:pelle-like serine/threonine-protein kinase pik-1 [Periplaneta americana]|uniref:pelle-like serine/threonine-protein kinase pik-1 n=1 Tax=Periplaneta americana TaxID=6978 RepID=UPI0037E7C877
MANNRPNVKYVYHLPYFQRRELCRILDGMDKWEELGGKYMNFDMMTIQDLRREVLRGNSPSDELLTIWGHQNHTVLELFVLLSEMQHYQAMLVLKPFVHPDYHRLIYEGEEMLRPSASGKEAVVIATAGAGGTAAAAAVVNGDASRSNVPSMDKNMDIGRHNLNLTESTNYTHSKLQLRGQTPERKILNTRLSPSAPPGPSNEAARIPAPHAEVVPTENKENNAPGSSRRRMSNSSEKSSMTENCGTIPQIDYQELLEATQGWAKHNILGKGGFGTVFKGNWKNTQVAVKRIEQRGATPSENNHVQLEQSLRELRILNSVRHDNILPLFGISVGGGEPCLVYQFMPNGSLEDRLLCRKGTPPLFWLQRHNIAQGTARGLQFLHNNPKPFIHGDIKSANILLDINFIPRIGDFGLAREGPQNQYTHMKVSRVHGTRPYLPDEFLRSKEISTKVDTYSFGIVLFELATGLRAYDDSRQHKLLKEHVESCPKEQLESLIDKKAVPEDIVIFRNLVFLGLSCVDKRVKRPKMETVLEKLEALAAQHQPLEAMQYPGSLGALSAPGQPVRSNLTLAIPSHHPVPQALPNFPYLLAPQNTNGPNFPLMHGLSPSPVEPPPSSLSPQPYHFQPISAAGMHSPYAQGTPSHSPYPVTPQYVPSPEIEVLPPPQEANYMGNSYLPVAVMGPPSKSQESSRETTPDRDSVHNTDSSDGLENPLQNGLGVSALLPKLSILGVGEDKQSSRADASHSSSNLDLNANPDTDSLMSGMSKSSSAQNKPLLFF